MKVKNNESRKVVISGSFRKHYSKIITYIKEFEECDWQVLSPKKSNIVNHESDFIILESDKDQSNTQIENNHLNAIRNADILYVVNPEGYIGVSTSLEIGWALNCGVRVILQNKPTDSIIGELCEIISSPKKVDKMFSKIENDIFSTLSLNTSISQLQKYISKVVVKRGFSDESTSDILLLMVEEVGELAKAIRKQIGLKVDVSDTADRRIANELADVLIYLLDLANSCNVDLTKAFLDKEAENDKRHWQSSVPAVKVQKKKK